MLKKTNFITLIFTVFIFLSLIVPFASAVGWQINSQTWRVGNGWQMNTQAAPTLPPNSGLSTNNMQSGPAPTPNQPPNPSPSTTLDVNPTSSANSLFFVIGAVFAIILIAMVATAKAQKQPKKLTWKIY